MRYLVTGGAGFIGSNFVDRALGRRESVVVLDDLSRPGVEANLGWLRGRHGEAVQFVRGGVEDAALVEKATQDVDVVLHLAGQTAVTRSVEDPRSDFAANALGTLNVLEAARRADPQPIVLYASTNKVYGPLDRIPVEERATRWVQPDRPLGIDEEQPVDFHSPYGCSKGAGDQYARDYARIYGLRTVVLRQSCIYGPRQMGVEDQGWIAWFLQCALRGKAPRICGDGKQVRDVLFVDDLLDAYDAAVERVGTAAGEAYNLGGGPDRSLSVWVEFASLLEALAGPVPEPVFTPARPGDQKVYVSDVRKAERELGWRPRVGVEEGLRRLSDWIASRPGDERAAPRA